MIVALLVSLFIVQQGRAQEAQQTGSAVRLLIDNDFINYRGRGSDRYYTSGLQLEYLYPQKRKDFITTHLLINAGPDATNVTAWGFTHLMFTPSDIRDSAVIRNDRPYAGALYLTRRLKSFSNSTGISVQSDISIGVIGPFSFASDIQTWVHKAISYYEPEGWRNQIKTDIILNYNIEVAKQLLNMDKLQGNLLFTSRIGTLFDDLGTGFAIRAGKFNPSLFCYASDGTWSGHNKANKTEVYFFSSGQLKLVLGNALLQGGIVQSFKDDCEDFYHITEENLTRLVALYEAGIAVNSYRWGFTFSQHFISAEFKGADPQLFGRITIEYKFN
jgi:lipid A 3-O-deacylase